MYKVDVLFTGYARLNSEGFMEANGTCTLVVGENVKVIVDTLTPWDKDLLLEKLKDYHLKPEDITHLVCTHGHPDHIGNNNLFTEAKQHIVGFSVHHKDQFYLHPFDCGDSYELAENLYVLPTPGHTMDSVSLVVKTSGTENESLQREQREKVLQLADFIIPGHGPMFPVPKKFKTEAGS